MSDAKPRWTTGVALALVVLIVLSLAGVGFAITLQDIHESVQRDGTSGGICTDTAEASCDTIAASSYSKVFGVSIALWALGGYLFTALLAAFAFFRSRPGGPPLPPEEGDESPERPAPQPFGYGLLLLFSGVYLLASLVLLYIMKFEIGPWCPFCLALDGVNLAMFIAALAVTFMSGVGPARAISLDLKEFVSPGPNLAAVISFGILTMGGVAVYGLYNAEDEKELSLDGLEIGVTEEGHHWIGSANAPLIIEEFSDYQCPHCQKNHTALREKMKEVPGRVKLIHRHFPLPFHKGAFKLSMLTQCAGEQKKFWQANDHVFNNFETLKGEDIPLEEIAKTLELDLGKFNTCMDRPETKAAVEADLTEGRELGVSGTPTFVINGEMGAWPLDDKYWGKTFTEPPPKFDALDEGALKRGVLPDGRHWIGAESAPVTVEEFLDFQCPSCFKEHLEAREKNVKSNGKTRLVRRFFSQDPDCNTLAKGVPDILEGRRCDLARFVHCAGAQDKLWEANDHIASHLVEIIKKKTPASSFAAALSLDAAKLEACMESEETFDAIRTDSDLASNLGFLSERRGVLINGEVLASPLDPRILAALKEQAGLTLPPATPSAAMWRGDFDPTRGQLQAIGALAGLAQGATPDGTPQLGDADAPVVIEAFLDYSSHRSRREHLALRKLMKKHPGKARLVVHHFPIDMGCNPALNRQPRQPRATCPFRVAVCAGEQGKFWQTHDQLNDAFTQLHNRPLDPNTLAVAFGLSAQTFNACLRSAAPEKQLQKDLEQAQKLKANGVPSFIVNGEVYGEAPAEVFK